MIIKKILLKIKQVRGALHERLKSTRRSSHWNAFRDAYLKEHTKCVACGSTVKLQVHHIKPFHIEPSLELDTNNLITLCMSKNSCHLDIGHGGSFRSYNPRVVQDSFEFFRIFQVKPKKTASLLKEIKARRQKNQIT
jgi:5-methylcytosine-specific restriction protein A